MRKVTQLHYSTLCDKPDELRKFLEDMPVDSVDEGGATALHYAAAFGRTECAKVLLEHGADIYAKDQHNTKPVQLAIAFGRPPIIRFFLDHVTSQVNALRQHAIVPEDNLRNQGYWQERVNRHRNCDKPTRSL